MKLLYIANARIPTEKAHGLHIVKMCEAFSRRGAAVILVVPKRKNLITEDIFSYYGTEKNFSVRYLPVIDFVRSGFFGYWITQISFSWKLMTLDFDKREYTVITRDELSGWLMAKRKFRVFYDMHGFPETWRGLWRIAMRKMSGIICTNEWKMSKSVGLFGIAKNRLLLARNGFDPAEFNQNISKEKARSELGLPNGSPIVMYAGHLYDWKGARVLALAAARLEGVKVIFVGGTESDIQSFTKKYGMCHNISVLGQKPHSLIPLYLKAADVLVLPNSKKSDNPRAIPYSIYDTSPIKLFEYMASNRPIVASDLPSIREILDETTAVFFRPDDADDLAVKISSVLSESANAEIRANRAMEIVQEFTWDNRARRIVEFMEIL
ncbi:MAG: glycosyltransferase family 4 protein [Patescibacteria group bacterium]